MTPATARYRASRALGSRPLTVIALAAAVAAIVLDWYWPWGLLFVYWTVPNIQRGEAFLIEPISRARNPVLFWAITGMWAAFGVWILYADLAWRLS